MPEPDLPPLILSDAFIAMVRESLPELPDQLETRLISQYRLMESNAKLVTAHPSHARFFLAAKPDLIEDPNKLANWIFTELLGQLNKRGQSLDESPIAPLRVGTLVRLIQEGFISNASGKKILAHILDRRDDRDISSIAQDLQLVQISDSSLVDSLCDDLLRDLPSEVARYRAGDRRILKRFVVEAMRRTQNRANPDSIVNCLERKLGNE